MSATFTNDSCDTMNISFSPHGSITTFPWSTYWFPIPFLSTAHKAPVTLYPPRSASKPSSPKSPSESLEGSCLFLPPFSKSPDRLLDSNSIGGRPPPCSSIEYSEDSTASLRYSEVLCVKHTPFHDSSSVFGNTDS